MNVLWFDIRLAEAFKIQIEEHRPQQWIRHPWKGHGKSTEQLLLIKPLRRKVSAGRWLMINASIMKEALIQLWRAHDAFYKVRRQAMVQSCATADRWSQRMSFIMGGCYAVIHVLLVAGSLLPGRQIYHVLLRLARVALGCSSNNMWFGSSVQFICATVRGGTAKWISDSVVPTP